MSEGFLDIVSLFLLNAAYGGACLVAGALLERRRSWRIESNVFEGEPPSGSSWSEWWEQSIRRRVIAGLVMRAATLGDMKPGVDPRGRRP